MLSVAIVSFGVFQFLENNQTGTSHNSNRLIEIPWNSYSTTTTESESGFLLELKNDEEGVGVYIASDKVPSESDYLLVEGWKLSMISGGKLWNPRVCAQMPVWITGEGDIVMLDTRRSNAGIFKSFLVLFNAQDKNILETDVTNLGYMGNVTFIDAVGNPFFFGTHDEKLFVYTLLSSKSALEERFVDILESDKNVKVVYDSNREPIIKMYDKTFVSKYFTYTNSSLQFVEKPDILNLTRYLNEEYSIVSHLNDIEVYSSLDTSYGSKIMYKGKSVFEFGRESKVYTYTIGSYTSK